MTGLINIPFSPGHAVCLVCIARQKAASCFRKERAVKPPAERITLDISSTIRDMGEKTPIPPSADFDHDHVPETTCWTPYGRPSCRTQGLIHPGFILSPSVLLQSYGGGALFVYGPTVAVSSLPFLVTFYLPTLRSWLGSWLSCLPLGPPFCWPNYGPNMPAPSRTERGRPREGSIHPGGGRFSIAIVLKGTRVAKKGQFFCWHFKGSIGKGIARRNMFG